MMTNFAPTFSNIHRNIRIKINVPSTYSTLELKNFIRNKIDIRINVGDLRPQMSHWEAVCCIIVMS